MQLTINALTTMTTREVAELTGKDHKNVLADARKMLAEIGSAEKSANLPDAYGRPQPVILLDKEQTLCLVSGYSAQMRMAIIRRWQELEALRHPAIPQTFAEALRLAADQQETIQQQAAQIEAARPAVEFAERHASAGNLLSLRSAAKALRFPEQAFISALIRDKFLFRDPSGRLMPFADKQHGGLFDVVTGEANGHAYVQAKITPAGMQKMADRYASELG
jgi:phage antirepressor YoqD-like protein